MDKAINFIHFVILKTKLFYHFLLIRFCKIKNKVLSLRPISYKLYINYVFKHRKKARNLCETRKV
jgi:hypothetical protein